MILDNHPHDSNRESKMYLKLNSFHHPRLSLNWGKRLQTQSWHRGNEDLIYLEGIRVCFDSNKKFLKDFFFAKNNYIST